MGRSARLRRASLHGLRAFGTSPMRGCGPSPLRRDPLGPGSGGSPQGWAGSGSRPRSGAPGPLPRGGPACAVRGAPVPGAGAPRATRPAPLASVVCGRSPGAPACGRGRRGPLFGHSSLAVRPVASYLGPVPGSLVGPGRPSASPAGVPPGSAARPPAASFLRPRGAALCVPAPAGPPSAPVRAPSGRPSSAPAGRPSSGPLAGSPPPAASACRAGSRPNGGRFGRPPPPRGFGGPPVPPLGGGAGAPSVWRCAPGLFALRRCSAARRLRWGPRWCCVLLLGLLPVGGFSPSPSPLPLPRWGRGRAPGPTGGKPPRGVRFSRTPLGPPAPSGRCRMALRLAGRLSENCQPPRRPRL